MDSIETRKRKRASSPGILPTPPASDYDLDSSAFIDRATNILATEAAALSSVTRLYKSDPTAQGSLRTAVERILKCHRSGSKLVVCGVGKSAYIGMKLVATCKSLGINASFMHACEAAHGDLGDVQPGDIVMFVSYSGKSPELLNLLPHLPDIQLMSISSQMTAGDCLLLSARPGSILLPAPIDQSEEASFGVGAPTTSTTVALAVADMLALTVADHLHSGQQRKVFKRNHPGGAIGMNHREVEELKKDGVEVSILELPSPSILAEDA